MEIKQILSLVINKNERIFRLDLPVGAPLGDTYEAVWEMLKKVSEMINESVDRSKMDKEKKSGDE